MFGKIDKLHVGHHLLAVPNIYLRGFSCALAKNVRFLGLHNHVDIKMVIIYKSVIER